MVKINIIEDEGLHRALTHVKHDTVTVGHGDDKMVLLAQMLDRYNVTRNKTIIFCNSIASCQALTYFLDEAGIHATSYHGDLNSRMRLSNLNAFRRDDNMCLVCTDIAARGLDIPDIVHVIMFDYPLNPVDYIHRSGRCGRAGRHGFVTSFIEKRDKVLSDAIKYAIEDRMPLESLSSNRKDYTSDGKLLYGRAQAKKKGDHSSNSYVKKDSVARGVRHTSSRGKKRLTEKNGRGKEYRPV
jgi:superfamily II DNA/RNA helicase